MNQPTEITVVNAAYDVIRTTQVPVLGTDPVEFVLLKSAVFNRWIFSLTVGEVMDVLRAANDNQRINGWSIGISSWIPSNVTNKDGKSVTPPAGFTSGFDDAVTDQFTGHGRDYKKRVDGTLKIWQAYQYDLGNDTVNSQAQSSNERNAVIQSFDTTPRIGVDWFNFKHDCLKFPAIAVLNNGDTSLHIAQGNLSFSFEYVATATQ